MKEDEWFVVRWEELENLRKKDVLSKLKRAHLNFMEPLFSSIHRSFTSFALLGK